MIGLFLAMALADTPPMTFIDQPRGGYEAIRFTRRVVLEDFNVRNDAYIQPGTWLVHDRSWKGRPLWCGAISVNLEGALMHWCFVYEEGQIQSALGDQLGRPIRLQPQDFVTRRYVIE